MTFVTYQQRRLTSANTQGQPMCKVHGRPVIVLDLYCRISKATDGSGGLRSVDDQERDGRKAIRRLGPECCFQIGRVFKDPALSGWDQEVVRPDFNLMMDRMAAGKANGLWVYDVTRFSRKPIEGEQLIAAGAARGLLVLSGSGDPNDIRQPGNRYNLADPQSKKNFRSDLDNAALESDMIQKRTRDGKRRKAEAGGTNATWRGFACDGYLPQSEADRKLGKLRDRVPADVLEREQEAVREVARRLLAGHTLESCAAWLNVNEIFTPAQVFWTGANLRQLLRKRPSLAGLASYKGAVLEDYDNPGEPKRLLPGKYALEPSMWFELQDLFDSRRRGRPATRYLCSGLLRCGECGKILHGRKCEEAKGGRLVYWCAPHKRQRETVGCMRVNISQDLAHRHIKKMTLIRLGDQKFQEGKRAASEESRRRLQEINAEIARHAAVARAKAEKAGESDDPHEDELLESWMVGYRRKIAKLVAEKAGLELVPASSSRKRSYEEALQEWANAEAADDLVTLRDMIREAFPNLTIMRAQKLGRLDRQDPAVAELRFDWDGSSLRERGLI